MFDSGWVAGRLGRSPPIDRKAGVISQESSPSRFASCLAGQSWGQTCRKYPPRPGAIRRLQTQRFDSCLGTGGQHTARGQAPKSTSCGIRIEPKCPIDQVDRFGWLASKYGDVRGQDHCVRVVRIEFEGFGKFHIGLRRPRRCLATVARSSPERLPAWQLMDQEQPALLRDFPSRMTEPYHQRSVMQHLYHDLAQTILNGRKIRKDTELQCGRS